MAHVAHGIGPELKVAVVEPGAAGRVEHCVVPGVKVDSGLCRALGILGGTVHEGLNAQAGFTVDDKPGGRWGESRVDGGGNCYKRIMLVETEAIEWVGPWLTAVVERVPWRSIKCGFVLVKLSRESPRRFGVAIFPHLIEDLLHSTLTSDVNLAVSSLMSMNASSRLYLRVSWT